MYLHRFTGDVLLELMAHVDVSILRLLRTSVEHEDYAIELECHNCPRVVCERITTQSMEYSAASEEIDAVDGLKPQSI